MRDETIMNGLKGFQKIKEGTLLLWFSLAKVDDPPWKHKLVLYAQRVGQMPKLDACRCKFRGEVYYVVNDFPGSGIAPFQSNPCNHLQRHDSEKEFPWILCQDVHSAPNLCN